MNRYDSIISETKISRKSQSRSEKNSPEILSEISQTRLQDPWLSARSAPAVRHQMLSARSVPAVRNSNSRISNHENSQLNMALSESTQVQKSLNTSTKIRNKFPSEESEKVQNNAEHLRPSHATSTNAEHCQGQQIQLEIDKHQEVLCRLEANYQDILTKINQLSINTKNLMEKF